MTFQKRNIYTLRPNYLDTVFTDIREIMTYTNSSQYIDGVKIGVLAGSLLSNIIGNEIPGAGALWTDCNITFSKPVFKNDILSFESKISPS